MNLTIKHEIKGVFGRFYVEESTPFCDTISVKKALNELRKDPEAVVWFTEFTDSVDYEDVTAVCVGWNNIESYEKKVVTIKLFYGKGNVCDHKFMEWAKGRKYFTDIVNNA